MNCPSKFYRQTNQHIRDTIAKRLTQKFEDAAKADRENFNLYPEYSSPQSRNYMQYIRHRLKSFEQGITLYTTNKYTRLSFDQYICSINTFVVKRQWILL